MEGICCATEVPTVQAILRPYAADAPAGSIQISIATKRVYVHHYHESTTARQLCERLEQAGFPARVLHDGGAGAIISGRAADTAASSNQQLHPMTPARSAYVESTLQIRNLEDAAAARSQLTRFLQQQQENQPSAIRALHPVLLQSHNKNNSNNHTVRVEHDPTQVDADTVCERLWTECGLEATVLTDGAAEGLYLPAETNTSSQEDVEAALAQERDWQSTKLQLHVILSGLFWLVSMVGAFLAGTSENESASHHAHHDLGRHLQYAGLLSVAAGLPPVAAKAYRTARRCQLDANCMMVIAAVGALLLGEFDEAASVSFLFAVSEYLEARASRRARIALEAIVQLRPDHAHWLRDSDDDDDDNDNETVVVVPAEQLPVHARIRVRTGDKIAADGVVVEGNSSVDQSSLTGESVPVRVGPGATVAGGSINVGSSPLVIRTTATVEDSAVSRLIRLVEDAQANRSPTEKMVDAFARAYTPGVVAVAAILATIPWFWGTEIGRYWTLNGLILVVIACPCALTISTPVTYAAGLAAAAQRGIVVKGGASLEALGSVRTVIFDKTGTITEGKFAVSGMEVIGASRTRSEMLALLAVMEAPSSHPLAATLVKAAEEEGIVVPKSMEVKDHTVLKGEGVSATINGKKVYVGNDRLFSRIGMYEQLPENYKALAEEWGTQRGGTVGFIGIDGDGIIGSYCVTDVVRPEAKEAIAALQFAGINVVMLTGDGKGAANAVAQQVGLSESAVHSQLLPEDKLHFVGSLKYPSQGNSFGLFRQQPRVLFCGDGVNDAPALAIADVGVSMGEGAALAMEMSDVTLMDSNLSKIVFMREMGSRVLNTIRENILLSLFCKLAVVVLTFGGYMTLLYAIASDVGVMLLVTVNGMKLLPGIGDRSPKQSRYFAWKRYAGLPNSSGHSEEEEEEGSPLTDFDVEIV